MGGSKVMMSNGSHHDPPIIDRNKACTGLPEAGDRRVGLEEFANHLDRVQVQIVVPEAAKRGP